MTRKKKSPFDRLPNLMHKKRSNTKRNVLVGAGAAAVAAVAGAFVKNKERGQ